jgi:hypothetical protein
MDLTTIAIWVAALGGLYALGLSGYRIFVAIQALKVQLVKAKSLINDIAAAETNDPAPAAPTNREDLVRVISERQALKRARARKAEAQQRRLVQRIRDIEIDKR